MPFTLSHAAAVLPVRKAGFVTSAFVIGTFAPDSEYFLRLAPRSAFGHHWPGVLVFTLPVSLVALWVFHAIVKRPAAALLPSAVEARLTPYLGTFRFGGLRRFGWILISVAAGIGSHLLWDLFTHKSTLVTRSWPLFAKQVPVPLLHSMPLYKFLQHVSTLIGLFAIAIWFLLWMRATSPVVDGRNGGMRALRKLAILGSITGVAVAGALARALLVRHVPNTSGELVQFVVVFGIAGIAFFAGALLVYGIAWTSTARLRSGGRAVLNN